MKQREPRRKVMVRARMRRGTGWGDVTIHNMSSRGLLATADEEFRPGTVIEIRRIHHIIVGRVVWAKGQYFGVRTQDKIDIDGIVSAKPPAQKPGTEAGTSGSDRRGANRAVSVAEREAKSRRFAARFQFVVMLIGIGAAGLIAVQYVSGVLSTPLAAVSAALDGK